MRGSEPRPQLFFVDAFTCGELRFRCLDSAVQRDSLVVVEVVVIHDRHPNLCPFGEVGRLIEHEPPANDMRLE